MGLERIKEFISYDPDTGLFLWLKDKHRSKKGTQAGCISKAWGYRIIGFDGKLYPAHRLAFLFMTGEIPAEVDHKNGNRLDNRWCNLRICTSNGNNRNMKRKPPLSGFVGVAITAGGRFPVRACVNKVNMYFGTFTDFELACLVSEEARDKWHKQFSVLNRGVNND